MSTRGVNAAAGIIGAPRGAAYRDPFQRENKLPGLPVLRTLFTPFELAPNRKLSTNPFGTHWNFLKLFS